jgi:hypothetical protein
MSTTADEFFAINRGMAVVDQRKSRTAIYV